MKKLNILHLYPNEMNIYGDHGNLLVLTRRAVWHGYEPVVHYHHAGQKLPAAIDLVLGGGGQDSAQSDIQADVLKIGTRLQDLTTADVPMLMICGMYQLFCNKFVTHTGEAIQGIGIFDADTFGNTERLVGNCMVESPEFGILLGFENHSGRTHLRGNQAALGEVRRGNGNNGGDHTEGARTHNVFGSYLHGPVLPNNPHFADALIGMAATNVYGSFDPQPIDDSLSLAARANAQKRSY